MEWDFKDFACWDSSDELDQLEKKEESDLAALVGSSISKGQRYNNRSAGSLPLVVDLKLGNGPLNKLQEDQMKLSAALVSSSSSSPKSSSVRRVVHNNGSDQRQKVSCLVDGCKADLRRCREYHRRHRVCELHSKTPVVIVRGEQKRFCQQCSRFHSLVEFDEVKRSCRKRLNGHNQRRRKPKPESLYFSSNSFFSNYKGPRILQFSNPQLCATTNVRSVWPVEAKKGSEPTLYNRHQWWHAKDQRSPPPNSFKGEEKPFLILQKNDPKAAAAAAANRAAPQAFVCHQPFPTTAASPDSRKLGGRIMSSDGITRGIDSGCALYLLSSQPTQNSVAGLNQHSVQSSATTRPGQLLDSRLQTNGFSDFSCSHDVEDKPVNPEMMFLLGPDGFYDNGAQMLPILLE